jgi:hypothetical protein
MGIDVMYEFLYTWLPFPSPEGRVKGGKGEGLRVVGNEGRVKCGKGEG